MKIKEITWQHRNDFEAILKCEHCGNEQELTAGYDDSFYHNKVIPNISCNECNLNRAGKNSKANSATPVK